MNALAVRLVHDETGSTAIEYALIASMIAFTVIVGITAYATSVADLWSGVANTINGALS